MNGFQIAATAYNIAYWGFVILFFLFFGFNISTFLGFLLTLIISVLIAVFLLIYLSPTFCDKDGKSNIGIYMEAFIYGLLAYLIYFYMTSYVMPFYSQSDLPNQMRNDLIFGGIILTLFAIITVINTFVQSSAFSTINFYTFLLYLLVLSMKIYIIWKQWTFMPPSTNPYTQPYSTQPQQGGGRGFWKNIWVREPDYIKPHRHHGSRKMKSAFYEFS